MRLEEQISKVTGGAPSLKLCRELTLTMLTTRGARPATPQFERRAAAASRPQGASQRTGAAPTVRRQAWDPWVLAVVVVAERRPCHAAVSIGAVAEIAGCRRTPGRWCPCIGREAVAARHGHGEPVKNPAMPLQALPFSFSPKLQSGSPRPANETRQIQASKQNGKAYRFNPSRF